MRKIDIVGMEHLVHALAKMMMTWNEPIPPFATRFPGVLEGCIETPFATFGGNDLYPALIDKAAVLFYVLIKNHPFQNGNKRVAVIALAVFFVVNDKWLQMSNEEIYDLAMFVAGSKPENKDLVMGSIKNEIADHLENEVPKIIGGAQSA